MMSTLSSLAIIRTGPELHKRVQCTRTPKEAHACSPFNIAVDAILILSSLHLNNIHECDMNG